MFWVGGVWLYSIILVLRSIVLYLTLIQNVTCFQFEIWQKWTLLSQRLVKVVTTLLLELSFVLVRLTVRYLNRFLPNHSLCARQTRSSSRSCQTTKISTLQVQHKTHLKGVHVFTERRFYNVFWIIYNVGILSSTLKISVFQFYLYHTKNLFFITKYKCF